MSSDEFMIPSNENNIVKYGIVGIVAVVVLGTIYCFMTKKLMFKKNTPTKTVEKFQPVMIDYNNQVEKIIQVLMKDQGLYTKNNNFVTFVIFKKMRNKFVSKRSCSSSD